MKRFVLFSAICAFFQTAFGQDLVINELSQGPSGSKEYVELVVNGIPTCQTPIPCKDLRGMVIDDNNGYFASGSGKGIASGAIRFASIPFWSCIPQGTIIVIYNHNDINTTLPPDDQSMTDGNCRLILPGNSPLLEGTSIAPSTADPNYPPTANWSIGGANWTQMGMANSDDSFQIRSSINDPVPDHSVSWGNNTSNAFIYFPTANGRVFSFMNTTNNAPNVQGNWSNNAANGNETPGVPNGPQNAAWIGGLNPNCGIATSLEASLAIISETCSASCIGSIQCTVSGGNGPYTYSWSNGATGPTISNLCPGTYTVTVTDIGGCTTTEQINLTSSAVSVQGLQSMESCENGCDANILLAVSGGTSPYSYQWSNGFTGASQADLCAGTYNLVVTDVNGCIGTFSATIDPGPPVTPANATDIAPLTTVSGAQQLLASPLGGSWQANCGSCISASGTFDPAISGEGIFTACYTVGSGGCLTTDCLTIIVTEGCLGDSSMFGLTICPGDSVEFAGNFLSTAGTYSDLLTDQNGCDSLVTLNLSLYNTNYPPTSYALCVGDSILLQGSWIANDTVLFTPSLDQNGCAYIQESIVQQTTCIANNWYFSAPNVFTPNGDLVNDLYYFTLQNVIIDVAYILNRYGEVVGEISMDNPNWDGKDKAGNAVSEGEYFYICTYRIPTGETKQAQGILTLVK